MVLTYISCVLHGYVISAKKLSSSSYSYSHAPAAGGSHDSMGQMQILRTSGAGAYNGPNVSASIGGAGTHPR